LDSPALETTSVPRLQLIAGDGVAEGREALITAGQETGATDSDFDRLAGVSAIAPRQLDFHYTVCGKLCGILSGSPQKIFKFFSCQLLIDFGTHRKPLFFNNKYHQLPGENPCSPGEVDHAAFRKFPQSAVNVK
jgi:hypothetical protein